MELELAAPNTAVVRDGGLTLGAAIGYLKPPPHPSHNGISKALEARCHTGKRIIIVDDHSTTGNFIKERLAPLYSGGVDYFEDPEAALTAIRSAHRQGKPYDVAVVDLYMPEKAMHGNELIKRIYAETPTACVINTASLMDHEALQLQRAATREISLAVPSPEAIDAFVTAFPGSPIGYHHKCELQQVSSLVAQIDTAMLRMEALKSSGADLKDALRTLNTTTVAHIYTDDLLHAVAETFRGHALTIADTFLALTNLEEFKKSLWYSKLGEGTRQALVRLSVLSYTTLRTSANLEGTMHELVGSFITFRPPFANEIAQFPESLQTHPEFVAAIANWSKAWGACRSEVEASFVALKAHLKGEIDLSQIINKAFAKRRGRDHCDYVSLRMIDPSKLLPEIIESGILHRGQPDVSIACNGSPGSIAGGTHYALATKKMEARQFGAVCRITLSFNTGYEKTSPDKLLGEKLMYQLLQAEQEGSLVWIVEETTQRKSWSEDHVVILQLYIRLNNKPDVESDENGPKIKSDSKQDFLSGRSLHTAHGLGANGDIVVAGPLIEHGLFADPLGCYFEHSGKRYIGTERLSHAGPAYVIAQCLDEIGIKLGREFVLEAGKEQECFQIYLDHTGLTENKRITEMRSSPRGWYITLEDRNTVEIERKEFALVSYINGVKINHFLSIDEKGNTVFRLEDHHMVLLGGVRLEHSHEGICIDGYSEEPAVQAAAKTLLEIGVPEHRILAKRSRNQKYMT